MSNRTNSTFKVFFLLLSLGSKPFRYMHMTFFRAFLGMGCLCSLLAFAACGPRTEPATVSTDQARIEVAQIRQFIEAFDSSVLNKDTTRLNELMDSNYVYFSSRGSVMSKQDYLDRVGHPTYRVENMSRTEITPHIHGSVAIVGTRWTATPYYKGVRYEDDQRCVLVISNQTGSLRLLSSHCTQIME